MSDYRDIMTLAKFGEPSDADLRSPSARKPHRDFVGYVCELRNKFSGGHNIILDCKRAQGEGTKLVENYEEEGGRYQVVCNEHSTFQHTKSLPAAREWMKDATVFCEHCRALAGEGDGS